MQIGLDLAIQTEDWSVHRTIILSSFYFAITIPRMSIDSRVFLLDFPIQEE